MARFIDANVILRYMMKTALMLFGSTSLDFVDTILIARNRVLGEKVFSFDSKLNKLLET